MYYNSTVIKSVFYYFGLIGCSLNLTKITKSVGLRQVWKRNTVTWLKHLNLRICSINPNEESHDFLNLYIACVYRRKPSKIKLTL